MKKYAIEPRDHSQNGVEMMVQVVKHRASCFLELLNAPKELCCCAVELAVLGMSRTGVASLDWKAPYEAEFGEALDTSRSKCKFYQLVRACNQFVIIVDRRMADT